ncbi:type VII secretion integral membrane protein EccD [Micromonospora krabiensis]|uniref:Type VII secretion integral membrane protein EccD n=1 Tax=Micromonospora krabiensis TaxID=307121 RepID=A0A1C3MXL3_9ACTN|nr:type VII secretion integral membrane protein EccD [Micromonospora krabiensis]SBV25067.1 type VII secretion integral membrane protein EccD [Micromonospora krabiensis]
MSVTAPAEMCRLVVSGPGRQIEVAVPANVLIADLLPALLHHLGDNLADAGLAHGGWVLQRLGGAPLDEEGTTASLGLRDGETVFLRPRAAQLPPVDFDDLADGIATGVDTRSGRWRPSMIRWAALGLFAVAICLGAVALALPGPPLARALCAATVATLALAAAFGLTRAGADRGFGLAAAAAAITFAALTGLIAPDLTRSDSALVLGGPQAFTAAVTVLVVALLAAVLVGWAGPFFAAVVAAALLGAVGSALAAFVGFDAGQAAGITAAVGTMATVNVPMLAFHLARIRLAPLPTEPEHLQEDIEPEPSEELLARTGVADRYMTALYTGAAAAVGTSLVIVATAGGWAAWTLLWLVALVRLLALRPMTSAWHRLAHAVPAVAGIVTLAVASLAHAPALLRLLVPVTALPLAGVLFFLLGRLLPGRRLMPYWGRIGDIVQLVATVAIVPTLLTLLGVYAAARALAG